MERRSHRQPWGGKGGVPHLMPRRGGKMRVWEDPRPSRKYIIGADVATGTVRDLGKMRRDVATMSKVLSTTPDYSAAIVIEQDHAKHVASWHGHIPITEYAEVLAAIGAHYNNALIVPERNGVGEGLVDILYRVICYPQLYVSKLWNRAFAESELGSSYGWVTTGQSRGLLIQRIEEWLASAPMTQDASLLKELRTMQYDERGVPRGIGRDKDDRVLALGLALQGRYEKMYGQVGRTEKVEHDHLQPHERALWEHVFERMNKHGDDSVDRRYSPRDFSRGRDSLGDVLRGLSDPFE